MTISQKSIRPGVATVVGAYAAALGSANVALFQNLEKFAKGLGPITENDWNKTVRPVFESEIKAKNVGSLASMLSQIKTFVIAKSHGIVPIKAVEGRALDTFSGYVLAARKPLQSCKAAKMATTGRNNNKGRPTVAKRQPRTPVAPVKAFNAAAFESMAGFMLDAKHAKQLTAVITNTQDRATLIKWLDGITSK